MSQNDVILLPLVTEVVLLEWKISSAEIIKIFATNISERGSEAAAKKSYSEGENESGEDDETMRNMEYGKTKVHQ